MDNLDTSLRVPVIVSSPGHSFVPVYTHPVELLDIYPTMAVLAGLPLPPDVDGEDVSRGLLSGEQVKTCAWVFDCVRVCVCVPTIVCTMCVCTIVRAFLTHKHTHTTQSHVVRSHGVTTAPRRTLGVSPHSVRTTRRLT